MTDEQQPNPQQQSATAPTGFNDDSIIKLNDNEYRFGDLSEQAKQLLNALQASEQQLQNARNQLGLMDVGQRALAAQLRIAIENPEALQSPESKA